MGIDLSLPGTLHYKGGVLPPLPAGRPGMYTFRTFFKLDQALAGRALALNAGIAEYPHRIYLNGIEILSRGRYKDGTYNSSIRAATSVHLSPDLLNYGEEPNSLVYEMYSSAICLVWYLYRPPSPYPCCCLPISSHFSWYQTVNTPFTCCTP